MSLVGAVIIGRNEGERLKRCIYSVINCVSEVVYVDSGSTDGSQEFARSHNIPVIDLDTAIPFTAGRARNSGLEYFIAPDRVPKYIQFIDGDCELDSTWVESAVAALEEDDSLAIVCGRRRERFIENSVYNQMCDIEWDTPSGKAESCGGDFLVSTEKFLKIGGFNPSVIAGEEPELCYRLRKSGYSIERLDREMTMHDASITRFSQWWKRTLRSGHAYANNMALHFRDSEKFNVRKTLSIVCWGIFLPITILALILNNLVSSGLLLGLLYVVLFFKIFLYSSKTRKLSFRNSMIYAFFTVIGKLPQGLGVIKYFLNASLSRDHTIIDYKQ